MIRQFENLQFDNKSNLGIIQITGRRCTHSGPPVKLRFTALYTFPPLYTQKPAARRVFVFFGGRVAVPCLFCAPERTLEKDRPRPQRRLPASSAGRGRRHCPLPGGFLCYVGLFALMGRRAFLPSQSQGACAPCASSPVGGAKCTTVKHGKLCCKAKL